MKWIVVLLAFKAMFLNTAFAATPAVDAFWQTCRSSLSVPPSDDFYRVRQFGRNQAVSDRILELIAAGEKTVTFTSPWLFEGNPQLTPVVGGYAIVTNFDGAPVLLLRTTALKTKPFQDIDEEDSQYEGPSVRTQEAWRRVHWDFFTDALKSQEKTPTMDMPVTVERFEVVCRNNKG